jgi:hypothetical protein
MRLHLRTQDRLLPVRLASQSLPGHRKNHGR